MKFPLFCSAGARRCAIKQIRMWFCSFLDLRRTVPRNIKPQTQAPSAYVTTGCPVLTTAVDQLQCHLLILHSSYTNPNLWNIFGWPMLASAVCGAACGGGTSRCPHLTASHCTYSLENLTWPSPTTTLTTSNFGCHHLSALRYSRQKSMTGRFGLSNLNSIIYNIWFVFQFKYRLIEWLCGCFYPEVREEHFL